MNDRRRLPPLATLTPFEAAARLESFTLAAAELGLTQAAVSKQVRALERDLGTALFERRNRAVFLTEEGRRLGRIVGAALSDIGEAAGKLRGGTRSGEVVLFCQLCEAFYWLMPRLSRFHRLHPDVELRVASSTRPIVDAEGPFDVAIQTSGRRHGSFPLAFTASDEIFPVCSPHYIERKALPLALADLRKQALLSHRVVPQDWIDWDGWLAEVGSAVRVGAHDGRAFDSYPLVLQAAVSGQGIALGWRRTVETLLKEGALIRPCRESVVRPAEISVFTAHGAGRSRAEVAALLAWLKEELAG
ncbi:LysR substrate-binding domain-containing protein [Afifella sp. IM 167]|uniref:LysR substrate-binding domain-containing protein n=1 Tax=Afifella sp. IM 167 TaxID=2033586 RepID=UPI001CCD5A69|nr:LysR substrate-binding domain-containing protein [Afifella sp. IM 167]MBZ8131867.1 LysR family transcriptional regulator [Afifella sp. IM 167]